MRALCVAYCVLRIEKHYSLPHFFPVEHGVERGHFIHPHGYDLTDLCHLVHRGEGQKIGVLSLSQV